MIARKPPGLSTVRPYSTCTQCHMATLVPYRLAPAGGSPAGYAPLIRPGQESPPRRRHEGHMRDRTYHLALISGFLVIHQPARAQQGTPGPVTTAFRSDAE